MSGKQRLSASVDADLLTAAETAVSRGRFVSLSAWVNEALRLKLEQDRRLEALGNFIAGYEREHGEITTADMETAARRARAGAKAVRGPRQTRPIARQRPKTG
jgi:Arc/MetJ-type ribon-helix-helix transcriptional regulator